VTPNNAAEIAGVAIQCFTWHILPLLLYTRQRKKIRPGRNEIRAFAIAVAFLCSPAVAEQPLVHFLSLRCQGFHGKNRWVTKRICRRFPFDKSAVPISTPSQIYNGKAWGGMCINGRKREKNAG